MVSTATIMWGVVFGSVGLGFFMYGRKTQSVVPLICGIILIVVPYLIDNALLLVLVGLVLMLAPFFIRQ